jgi:hypothetical protein
MGRIITSLAYLWNSPNTLLGLLIGMLNPALPRWHGGAFEFYLQRGLVCSVCRLMRISAFTLGDCVLYAVPVVENLRVHEMRHVRQYRLLGPFFLPLYFLLLAAFGYCDHPFERDARRHEERICGKLYASKLMRRRKRK